MFDAQEYLRSVQPPQFKDRFGRVHVGRVLSVDQWTPLEAQLRQMATTQNWEGLQLMMRKLVREFFPHPWWAMGRSVESHVFRLPPIGQVRAVWDFMQSQGKALGVTMKAPPPGMQRLFDSEKQAVESGVGSPTDS